MDRIINNKLKTKEMIPLKILLISTHRESMQSFYHRIKSNSDCDSGDWVQEPRLFSTDIASNIGYGAGGSVSQRDVEAAARQAHAEEFIGRLPEGYRSAVDNSRLSGVWVWTEMWRSGRGGWGQKYGVYALPIYI